MADRIRDRTLALRVLPPALQARLRDKMMQAEEEVSQRAAEQAAAASAALAAAAGESTMMNPVVVPGGGVVPRKEEKILDLDGVVCQPCEDGSTLWHFQCDGVVYPARLANLPCPVEIHKTHDHAMYYKCADIGQILIVYEDETAMEEAESAPGYKVEGFPSYYHSGLTPPMNRVVERRFGAREHKSVAPPRVDVSDVEKELKNLIATISRDSSKSRSKSDSGTQEANKVIEDVVDDVVDYEPWMDDYGTKPKGIEFDSKDTICNTHPELWLEPGEGAMLMNKEKKEKDKKKPSSSSDKKPKDTTKTKKKKKESKAKKEAAAENDDTSTKSKPKSTKKGIAAKKNRIVDEVDQAAAQIVTGDDGDALEVLGDLFDFNNEDDITDFLNNDAIEVEKV